VGASVVKGSILGPECSVGKGATADDDDVEDDAVTDELEALKCMTMSDLTLGSVLI